MPSVGAKPGTVAEQRSTKEQFKTFKDNMTKYVLRKFGNPRDIIIFIQDSKDPYAQVDTDNTIKLSKEDKEYVILVTQLQEEAKGYAKRVQELKNNVTKLYDILWGQCTPCLNN